MTTTAIATTTTVSKAMSAALTFALTEEAVGPGAHAGRTRITAGTVRALVRRGLATADGVQQLEHGDTWVKLTAAGEVLARAEFLATRGHEWPVAPFTLAAVDAVTAAPAVDTTTHSHNACEESSRCTQHHTCSDRDVGCDLCGASMLRRVKAPVVDTVTVDRATLLSLLALAREVCEQAGADKMRGTDRADYVECKLLDSVEAIELEVSNG